MRKIFALFSVLVLLTALSGCGTELKNDTPEALIQNYLSAVKGKDYEAVWNMIPSEIQDYAIEQSIITGKEDGLDYIYYALNDYYWLVSLDLPSRESYAVEVIETHIEDRKRIQKALSEEGMRLVLEDVQYIECSITADNDIRQNASFFVIKSSGAWYLLSVVGDDEVFAY